jgi:hypothetical protein
MDSLPDTDWSAEYVSFWRPAVKNSPPRAEAEPPMVVGASVLGPERSRPRASAQCV